MALSRNEKITIFAALLSSPLVTVIIDFFRSVPVFSTIKSAYTWTLDFAISILTYEVQLWIVILFFILIIVALGIYGSRDTKIPEPPQFNFLNYVEDNIVGYKWTWTFELDPSINKYVISNHKAYCPNCDSPLRFKNEFLNEHTECIRCDFKISGNIYGDMHKIESLILDNIARMSKPNISRS